MKATAVNLDYFTDLLEEHIKESIITINGKYKCDLVFNKLFIETLHKTDFMQSFAKNRLQLKTGNGR